MKNFIAKKYRGLDSGLSLDTEAISKYGDLIDLSIGDTDIVTDERVIDAAFRDAKRGYTHYGDPKGDPELIAELCRTWREDFGQMIEPERVLVTASSGLGMEMALLAVLEPGEEVIVPSPCYPVYRDQIAVAGGVCVDVPLFSSENFEIRRERLERAVTSRTKAVIFNNPNNPTGMVYDRATTQLIADFARDHDLLVIADEIYTDYVFTGTFTPMRTLPGMAARTVTLGSFSKNYLMTGWRVGSAIAEPELIETMNYINGALIYSAPSISQRAAICALRERKRIRERYIAEYRERVEYAADRVQGIPYLGLVRPQGTFYLFPSIKAEISSERFCSELLERAHVLTAPGSTFGPSGEGHFRIACTVGKDKLCEAFDRMEKLKF